MFLFKANLCNNAYVDNSGKFHGQATEVALLDLLHRLNVPDGRPVNIVSAIS